MTKPDIVFIAYRYKAGTAYSILPEDGSADIDFARASSATRKSSGLIESETTNVPRIDYFGGGCPALLLEKNTENILTYTNDFAQAYWTKSATLTANSTISPDGTTNASTLEDDSAVNFEDMRRGSLTVTANENWTAECYIKKTVGAITNYPGIGLSLGGGFATGYIILNTTTGAFNLADVVGGTYSGMVEDADEYWKCSLVFNSIYTSAIVLIYPALSTNGTTLNSAAVGTAVVYQANVKKGVPTSTIISTGSATTRAIDTPDPIAITATPTGTLLIDLTTCLSDSVGDVGVALKDSSANQIEILFNGADNENLVSSDGDDEATYKAAGVVVISFDGTDTRVFRNGALVETLDPITDDIESINFVQVGQTRAPKFAFWYTKLSDAECIQRSTL
jgi:hypothetical protein